MTLSRTQRYGTLVLTLVASILGSRTAFAQSPSADQMRQAGAAYDSAMAAESAGDWRSAANRYETADRLAPSAQAAARAIRAHRQLNDVAHNARAATLALRLLGRSSTDARMTAFANRQIEELASAIARVRVSCAGCEVEIDGALTSDTEFFVEPGAHTVVGHWSSNRSVRRSFTGTAGRTEEISMEAPPMPVETHTGTGSGAGTASSTGSGSDTGTGSGTGTGPGTGSSQGTPARGGLPPAVFITSLILTAGAGGVLIWSGANAMAGVQAYEDAARDPARLMEAQSLLADGQGRETRTNVMIGVTSGLGALTTVFAIFTRWGGGSQPRVEATPGAQSANGYVPGLSLRGRF